MTRRVFFGFNYDRDIWRANVVREAEALRAFEVSGFWDSSSWEEAKRGGDPAIKQLIDDGLTGTSVTVVLIGAETASRRWVRYEIQQSYNRGNGLLGVYLHNIADPNGHSDYVGANPFHALQIYFDLQAQPVRAYDWIVDDGYHNLGQWIEEATVASSR